MQQVCSNCKNKFDKPWLQKMCSRICSDESKKCLNREDRNCVYCKGKFEVKKTSLTKLCSDICRKSWALIPENKNNRILKGRKAMREKYGEEYPFKLDNFKDKSNATKIQKYGDKNYVNIRKAQKTKKRLYGNAEYNNMKKTQNTKKERYGDENYNNRKLAIATMKELYGVEFAIQRDDFKKKQKNTNLIRFGVTSLLKLAEVRALAKPVMMKRYGVNYANQNYELFKKALKSQYRIKQYKDTPYFYQGSYELHFLTALDKKGLLSDLGECKAFEYEFEGKKHIYHPDYCFRGGYIEIKSGWTYNKNGSDLRLQRQNEAKWKSVENQGECIVIVKSIEEIDSYINGLV